MVKLTERQRQVLGEIWGYMRSYGVSPSYKDLMAKIGISSKQTMADLLFRLEKNGYLKKEFGRKRGMSLTQKAFLFLADEGAFSMGINFYLNFDTPLLIDSREDSTHNLVSPHNDNTTIEMPEEMDQKPHQLSLFNESNTALGRNAPGKNLNQNKIEAKRGNSTNSSYHITVQNYSFHVRQQREGREVNILSKNRINIKAGLEKIFDLFK